MKSLRAELMAHVGSPSISQRLLIDQAVQLQLRIALMDADGSGGGMTERNQVQYLAWASALSRLLRQLGLEPAKPAKPDAFEYLAAINGSVNAE
jgi:hypothetical protein